jgi:hypothetical protein
MTQSDKTEARRVAEEIARLSTEYHQLYAQWMSGSAHVLCRLEYVAGRLDDLHRARAAALKEKTSP